MCNLTTTKLKSNKSQNLHRSENLSQINPRSDINKNSFGTKETHIKRIQNRRITRQTNVTKEIWEIPWLRRGIARSWKSVQPSLISTQAYRAIRCKMARLFAKAARKRSWTLIGIMVLRTAVVARSLIKGESCCYRGCMPPSFRRFRLEPNIGMSFVGSPDFTITLSIGFFEAKCDVNEFIERHFQF